LIPNRKKILRGLLILAPPILFACADFGITLYGQSSEYWSGQYSHVSEGSPGYAYYLSIHPMAFVARVAIWMFLVSVLISIVPEFLAMILAACLTMGHTLATAMWLSFRFGSYQSAEALIFFSAIVLVASFRFAYTEHGESIFDWRKTGLPHWTRWPVAALLATPPFFGF
jgi:hypothetical protein